MITVQDMLRRLTDVFSKDPNSNIGKLMSILAEQLQKLEQTTCRVEEWRDIDKAQGTTLDRIGENVAQHRGAATDEIYRILIKSKIARNLSTGDINTIIGVLSTALNTDPSEIKITERYTDLVEPEPAAISLIALPIERINAIGMNPAQFAQIVQKTVAAGVRVGVIELTGTFEYGAIGDPADQNAGFADITQTTGGTLGAAYSPGLVPDLPI
ncbi:hypothetical protein IJ21_18030 [Paenibacillus sp. 32O-W]|uniref:hypothetical protein n=1 Tax=Paenibacillus sp. 32O-W TaxID=1695218 RepID=UPI000720B9DA|nr:hypothetical protein [Paenibacillus sp. 32O-W]ALS27204.1 hypothetical protein IJ21_18030 [Paenibacillus sp. 32O-W]